MDNFTQILGRCLSVMHLHWEITLEVLPTSRCKWTLIFLYLKVKLMQMLYINGWIYWKVIFWSIVSLIGRILLSNYIRFPPMSKTSGKLTVRKGLTNPLYLRPPPIRTRFETLPRNNITPWGAMRLSTYIRPHYDNEWTKMCMSSQIFLILYAQSWATKILSDIWFLITIVI